MTKIRKIIYFIILIGFLVFLGGCVNDREPMTPPQKEHTNECQELAQKYDDILTERTPLNLAEICVKSTIPNIWVGGTLINKSCQRNDAYNRTECSLTLYAITKEGGIYYNGARMGIDTFKIGQFYKFDLSAECATIFSSASSGMFAMDYGKNMMPLNCSTNDTRV